MAFIRPPSPAGDEAAKKEGVTLLPTSTPPLAPRRKWLSFCLAIAGMTFLGYMLGAAVMFFQMPSSDFLSKAFLVRPFLERATPAQRRRFRSPRPRAASAKSTSRTRRLTVSRSIPALSMSVAGTQAFLVNMRGDVVHHWSIPYSSIWPDPPHVKGPVNDYMVCFFDCHLYPNGDLLVVFQGQEYWVNGYGLAKLDKDSKVIWKYTGNTHHDVESGRRRGHLRHRARGSSSACPKAWNSCPCRVWQTNWFFSPPTGGAYAILFLS